MKNHQRKACDGQEAWGYFNLGNMYRKGESITRDSFKAVEQLNRSRSYVARVLRGELRGQVPDHWITVIT